MNKHTALSIAMILIAISAIISSMVNSHQTGRIRDLEQRIERLEK